MRWILTFAMLFLPVLAAAQEAPALKTEKDKLSYAWGWVRDPVEGPGG